MELRVLVATALAHRSTLRRACLLAPLLMLTAVGCGGGSRRVTLPAWQKNVEQFVRERGRGDPAVLRDLTLPDESRRGFAMLGSDRPAESSDANGVLLAHREIGGQNWFIYLVGLIDKQRVREIRLAAMTVTENGRYRWKTGPDDKEALALYRSHNDRLWKQRFPDRAEPPVEYLGFPRPEDRFQLSVESARVVAVHPDSGATWELTLSAER